MRLSIASGLALAVLATAVGILTTFRFPSAGVADRDPLSGTVLVIDDCPWLAPADG